ncbi:YdbH domain-containing protein [Brevundimonas sp. Leaf363]|uniref:intermembrane phospholipid transport protein YdbH family protein n=1 Tax=Brevundimonas sp. Leaf363 TaxID=1736353 RepID=UPI000AEC0B7D|nr:YdbH domain-containing protein [Brevundimonas sp. Leaf363]
MLLALVVVAAALWLNRRYVAREVLVGWLDRKGVPSQVDIERLELNGFTARVRIGDPNRPDVTVERVEVDYAIAAPWSRTGLGLAPSRVRLVRPVLRARWVNGKLSLGSLDPLVDSFTSKPPRPDSTSPVVIVEQGRVDVTTEYGPVAVLGDARMVDGKLMRLVARVPAASLKSGETEARGLAGSIDLTTTGDRVAVRLDLAAQAARMGQARGETLALSLNGDLPYPDLKRRRGDGRAVLNGHLTAGRLGGGGTDLHGADLRLAFDGQTTGWLEAFRVEGRSDAALTAERISGAATGRRLSLATRQAELRIERGDQGVGWRLDGPATVQTASIAGMGVSSEGLTLSSQALTLGGGSDGFEATGPVDVAAGRLAYDALSLRQVSGRLNADVTLQGATNVRVNGGLQAAGGAWPLFGPATKDDLPELAALKRALGDFSLAAPDLRLVSGGSGTTVFLGAPVRVAPRNGGVLTVTSAGEPVFSARNGERGGGALNLTATRGRGLPLLRASVPRWSLTSGGFSANLSAHAEWDFGPARGLTLDTRGVLATDDGRLTYRLVGCTPVSIATLDFDENDAEAVSARVCAEGGQPLVSVVDGRWTARGRFEDLDADAPFLETRARDASGRFTATGGPQGLGLDATVAAARVEDMTTPRRFNALSGTGRATLAGERWSGDFALAHGQTPLAHLTLSHDGLSSVGGVVIDAPNVTFVEGGLQPSDLSPLAGQYAKSPATGRAAFEGRIGWTADAGAGTSSGRLVLDDLDFTSPAGPVKGLNGEIVFTSLTPLITAPDQHLRVDRIETPALLTDVDVGLSLDADAITLTSGRLSAAQGTVSIEPLRLPLTPGGSYQGAIVLDRVQFGDLIAGAGFGDTVEMDAVVSGRLPFAVDNGAFKILGGTLNAVQPGRLSIKRQALDGLEAGGGGEELPPSTVEDLAYQAMENLAFDTLTANVNSEGSDRLGVNFHIVGRHDPPQRQELRLTLAELISREFLKRELPLPSNTGIDLTLDTTFNINQIISDLLAIDRARRGEPDTPAAVPAPSP